MFSPVSFFLFLLGLIYFLYQDFFVWVKPKQYMKDIHRRKLQLKSHFRFLPDWFIGFIFLYEQPLLSVWWARIVILIATSICILGMVASINGPF